MLGRDISFSKTLNQSLFAFPNRPKTPIPKPRFCSIIVSFRQNASHPQRRDVRMLAGRSKKKTREQVAGRIERDSELRRELKRSARRKSREMAESLFYRLKNPNKNHPDNVPEEVLNQIGLGYDRMVQFMEKDDPNLKHPYDWYKYGEFGPYSWRGVVVGDPIVGGITDECVSFYAEVKNHEEWEKIEQFEMEADFGEKLRHMDKNVGFRRYWVFVRHPKWRLSELPWQQWTLVSEVVLEAGKPRLDKWNLMGRLGNKARKLITQCAAWFRPDIVYVKRPVYQCRFEPQEEFFRGLMPFLDLKTERDFMFELRDEDEGTVKMCTYYEALCRIVGISQKAFVDDVVNAFEKLSDEKKSRCLEFLLTSHPVQLLHPYTKEWKAKLEEMELGCDAPDDDDEGYNKTENEFTEWIEDDGGDDDDVQDDVVVDMEEGGDDSGEVDLATEDEDFGEEEQQEEDEEEDERYWDEKFKKALSSAEEMEKLAKWSVEKTSEIYKKQWKSMQEQGKGKSQEDGDETVLRGARAKVSSQEWKIAGLGRWRKRIKKAKIPPELFLRAAVRPFTYRNLVKEIVLTRHAILDGEIGRKE